MSPKLWIRLAAGLVAIFVLMQFLIFLPSFAHSNPEVTYTIQWDSERTETLVRTACFDCHSNETEWPWYSFIAPPSLLIGRDVNEGRDELNFSTGHRLDVGEMIEVIQEGEMPPAIYTIMHPGADFDESEKAALIAGLRATFGSSASDEDDD